MTEVWICTDCESEVDFDARREHLQDEHGVQHALAAEVCPHCGETACERATVLEAPA
jgi:rubrerythrin